MKIVAVIQARLGSTRLPRKVLLPLGGKSMLQNVVERVRRAKLIDDVVVACPPSDFNEILRATRIIACAPPVDDNDLIKRFFLIAKDFEADFIIRICTDNPCVEGAEIDFLVKNQGAYGDWNLLMNSESPDGGHDGFGGELYSLEMLQWMDRTIKDEFYREHPHLFWIQMDKFYYCGKSYPRGFRLDVNTEKDYQKVKRIYDFYGRNDFSVEEARQYLNAQDLEERVISP